MLALNILQKLVYNKLNLAHYRTMKKGGRNKKAKQEVEEIEEPVEVNQFELGAIERDCCK